MRSNHLHANYSTVVKTNTNMPMLLNSNSIYVRSNLIYNILSTHIWLELETSGRDESGLAVGQDSRKPSEKRTVLESFDADIWVAELWCWKHQSKMTSPDKNGPYKVLLPVTLTDDTGTLPETAQEPFSAKLSQTAISGLLEKFLKQKVYHCLLTYLHTVAKWLCHSSLLLYYGLNLGISSWS